MTINVDIWSDITCPWCYIGKRNFDNALSTFEHRDDVDVRWHSFELDPSGSKEPELTVPERHRRDFGGTVADARRRIGMVVDLATAAGLTYDLDRAMPVNSFDSHRLMKYAEACEVGEELREQLMRAYTSEGAIISDHETLVRIGVAAGLDESGTRSMLSSTDFSDAVRADEDEARRLGIGGVPTFVFSGRYAVSGAQRPESFTDLLSRGWAEQAASGVCTPGKPC